MANSTITGLSAASAVAPTTVLPVVESGASSTTKATITQVADATLDATVYDQTGTGATAITILSRLRQRISPLEYGAVADGVTNDATAIQNAINAAASLGRIVDLKGRSYAVTSALTMNVSRGVLRDGYIVPTGTFNLLSIGGGATGVRVEGLVIDGAGHNGALFVVDNANRVLISEIVANSAHRFAFVRKANVVDIRNAYALNLRGTYFLTWTGDDSNRSDIMRVVNSTCSFASGAGGYGLDWNGNCHSFYCSNFGIVGAAATTNLQGGVLIRNLSGVNAPAIGRFNDLEIDFPNGRAVSIEAGTDFQFYGSYIHGSNTASGIFVASGITAETVSVMGTKLTGHARYGIETTNTVLAANNNYGSNTLGNLDGPASAFIVPSRGLQVVGGNLELIGDANDYVSYNATSNVWNHFVGGTAVAIVNSSGLRLPTIPTSASGLSAGQLWNDGGTVKVV